jgi:hypothetical protein
MREIKVAADPDKRAMLASVRKAESLLDEAVARDE